VLLEDIALDSPRGEDGFRLPALDELLGEGVALPPPPACGHGAPPGLGFGGPAADKRLPDREANGTGEAMGGGATLGDGAEEAQGSGSGGPPRLAPAAAPPPQPQRASALQGAASGSLDTPAPIPSMAPQDDPGAAAAAQLGSLYRHMLGQLPGYLQTAAEEKVASRAGVLAGAGMPPQRAVMVARQELLPSMQVAFMALRQRAQAEAAAAAAMQQAAAAQAAAHHAPPPPPLQFVPTPRLAGGPLAPAWEEEEAELGAAAAGPGPSPMLSRRSSGSAVKRRSLDPPQRAKRQQSAPLPAASALTAAAAASALTAASGELSVPLYLPALDDNSSEALARVLVRRAQEEMLLCAASGGLGAGGGAPSGAACLTPALPAGAGPAAAALAMHAPPPLHPRWSLDGAASPRASPTSAFAQAAVSAPSSAPEGAPPPLRAGHAAVQFEYGELESLVEACGPPPTALVAAQRWQ
jgi:hypothetical protein